MRLIYRIHPYPKCYSLLSISEINNLARCLYAQCFELYNTRDAQIKSKRGDNWNFYLIKGRQFINFFLQNNRHDCIRTYEIQQLQSLD